MSELFLSIEPSDWSRDAEALLYKAVDSKLRGIQELRNQVQSGAACLFHVLAGGTSVCAVVLRVDETAAGLEGVVVAAGGRLPGVRLMDLLPHFESRFVGCKRIRIHTSRRGMVRALQHRGYELQEFVYSKAL